MSTKAGNSIASALDLGTLGNTVGIFEDTISSTNSTGYYKITIADNSKINLKLTGLSQNADLILLNPDGTQIVQSAASGNVDENIVQNLKPGSYYFYVRGSGSGTSYKLETSAISLGATPVDTAGDAKDKAKNLGTLTSATTTINEFVGNFNGLAQDNADYYRFQITDNSSVNLKLSGLSQNADIYLYTQTSSKILVQSSQGGTVDESVLRNLKPGTYYVAVLPRDNKGTTYQLEASATPLGAIPIDGAGDNIDRARDLGSLSATVTTVNDFVGNFNDLSQDYSDYYKFKLTENSTINLKLSGLSQNVNVFLRSVNGNKILFQSVNDGTAADKNFTGNLKAGDYSLLVFSSNVKGTNYKLDASATSLGAIPVDTAGGNITEAKDLGVLGTTASVSNEYIGDFNGFGTDYADYYKFQLSENSTVNLKVSGLSQDANIYLYNIDGSRTLVTSAQTGIVDENVLKNLKADTYYLSVVPGSGGKGTNYKLEASATSVGAIPADDAGDILDTAKDLGTLSSTSIIASDFLGGFQDISSDSVDYFKFQIADNSKVDLKFAGLNPNTNITLFDADKKTVTGAYGNLSSNLKAGTYYLSLYTSASANNGSNYQLDASATKLSASAVVINPGTIPIDKVQDIGKLGVSIPTINGTVNSQNFSQYYQFQLDENSKVDLKLSGLTDNADIILLTSLGNEIVAARQTGNVDEIISRNLNAGVYYLRVYSGSQSATGTSYKLDASAVSLGVTPVDNAGNSIDKAKDLGRLTTTVNKTTDFIGDFNGLSYDYADYYKFQVAENSAVTLKFTDPSIKAKINLLNASGTDISTSGFPSSTANTDGNITRNLSAGTYFVNVSSTGGFAGGLTGTTGSIASTGTSYQLETSAVSLGIAPVDNAGNSLDRAKDLGALTSTVTKTNDFIGTFNQFVSDPYDYYKFQLTDSSTIALKLNSPNNTAAFTLLDVDGNKINTLVPLADTPPAGTISQALRAGTYYISVNSTVSDPFGAKQTGTNYQLETSASSLGSIPVDNAGESLDKANNLGTLTNKPKILNEFIGTFYNLTSDFSDYYKFNVANDSIVNLKLNIDGSDTPPPTQLLDDQGGLIQNITSSDTNVSLGAGDYYLNVTPTSQTSAPGPGRGSGFNYTLAASTPDILDLAGNTIDTARDLGKVEGSQSFDDFIGKFDPKDYYRFEIKQESNINLALTPKTTGVFATLQLLDSKGGAVDSSTTAIKRKLQPGVYYALVSNNPLFSLGFGGTSDTFYTLDFTSLPTSAAAFQITGVAPVKGSNVGQASIVVKGTNFTPSTKFSIVDAAGKERAATGVVEQSDTVLTGTLDLTGLATGSYDVKVTDKVATATAPKTFIVTDKPAGKLDVYISAPGAIRPSGVDSITITYKNSGNTDIPAPLLTINATGGLFQQDGKYQASSVQFLGINKEGNAGVLPAGASGTYTVKFQADNNIGAVNFAVNTLATGENIDWAAIKDSSRPADVSVEAWNAIFQNFVQSSGTKAGDFQATLDQNATRLSQLGEYTSDISRLLAFELRQNGSQAIQDRSILGSFGRGNVNAFDISETTDKDGNVTIQLGSSQRIFQKQTNGSYKAATGDLGKLTKTGDIYQITEQSGNVLTFLANGKLDAVVDSNGNKVTAGYTGSQVTSLSYSNGDKVAFAYNPQGRINQVTDQVGQKTSYTYDAAGEQLLSVTDAGGTISYTYETGGAKANAIKSITYPDGTTSNFEYDAQGRLTKQSGTGGVGAVSYAFDSAGGITVTDANGKSAQVLVNERGQVAQSTDALGRTSKFLYDDQGNLKQVIAPGNSTAKLTYDSKNNVTSTTDALNQQVNFSYDPTFNQLSTVRDQKGQTMTYNYDPKGNLTSIVYPDSSKETFSYDAKGYTTVSNNRRSQETKYTYDPRGFLTKKEFADGTTANFEYDVKGNLTKATDADSSVTYAYDAANRLTNVDYGSNHTLAFTYDAGGRRTQMVDQDGFATNYSYDTLGRLKQLTDKAGANIISYTYDTVGQLAREDNGNGTFTTYSYDDAGQVLSIINSKADKTINSRFDYTYDNLGRRTSMTTLDGKTSYGYDGIGQLTSVTLPTGRAIEYKYDAAGNRTTVKDSGVTATYNTNNLNQYTTAGSATYTYDKDGNLTAKTEAGKTSGFSYDIENRLIGVTNADGTWQYKYDALGNRIATIQNGTRTDYLLDPTGLGDVVSEYNGASKTASYTYGLGLVSRVDNTNTAAFYDADAIGSTAGLTGSNGSYLNRYIYLPFGESLTKTETVANPFEYVGQYGVMNESNGLDFMRARFYTPGEGRFISADPIGINGGINLHSYVVNNPVSFVDLTGSSPSIGGSGGSWRYTPPSGSRYGQGSTPPVDKSPGVGTGKQGGNSGGTYSGGGGGGGGTDDEPPNTPNGSGSQKKPNKTNSNSSSRFSGNNPSGTQFDSKALFGLIPAAAGGSVAVGGGTVVAIGSSTVASGGGGTALAGFATAGGLITVVGVVIILGVVWILYSNGTRRPAGSPTPTGYKPAQVPLLYDPAGFLPYNPKIKTQVPVFKPKDPNDIIGPGGSGTDHWLSPDQILPYTIHFENQATATAPAILVNVSQKLDDNLDLTTFELGSFGFGSTNIDIPAGFQAYSIRLDLRSTINQFVDFTANLDTATRTVTWKIVAIDPLTGEPATGVTDGFLPPNNANKDGDGFVNYRIQSKADNPNGTTIKAQASIVFDTEAAIVTPIWSNKIDTNAPSSSLAALTATTTGTDIALTWAGTDDGSGVATYDVYVSTDGGAFTLWQEKTDKTTATYKGEIGKTYSFYTLATDNIGRTEVKTVAAQISTKLVGDTPLIPTISVVANDPAAAETKPGEIANPGQFTLTRVGDFTQALTVAYTLSGTATNETDYQKLTGSVSFKAGEDKAVVDINAIDDNIFEGTETAILTLTANAAYTLTTTNSATVNIADNETQPTVTIGDVSLKEGDSGTTNATFIITLSNPSTQPITVDYATTDGTGIAGKDYTKIDKTTLTFAPGETTKNITVGIIGNTLVEPDKTFKVDLSNPTQASLGIAKSGTGTILNDDVAPINHAPIVANPITSQTANQDQPVTITIPANTFNDSDIGDILTYTATLADGTPLPKWLAFNPTTEIFSGTPGLSDVGNLNLQVKAIDKGGLSAFSNFGLSIAPTPIPVLPTISIVANDPNAAETKPGETPNPGQFTLTRTGDFTQALAVAYLLTGTATNGTDYQTLPGSVTFVAGKDTATIDINAIDDNIFEGTETVTLSLTANPAYIIPTAPSPVISIADNETQPIVSIGDVSLKEGDSGTINATFTVNLSNPSTQPITVDYATSDGTATAGSDYTKIDKTTLTFAPGETTKNITVAIVGDKTVEPDETFKINLSNPTNATLATDESATGTIQNDDVLPIVTLTANDPDAAETKTGATPNSGQFTLTRSGDLTQTITVSYALSGTATNGSDYQTLPNTVTFKAGEDKAKIDLNVIDDKFYEGTETAILTLTANSAYTIATANTATINITDNDAQIPKLLQRNQHLLEIEGGTNKSLLKFTKMAHEAAYKNEVCAFIVDDEQGLINGIKPGETGYLAAALDRSQVIFSSLGDSAIDRQFDNDAQRYLNFAPGDRVQFLMVADDTLKQVKTDLTNGKPTANVLFSLPEANINNSKQAQFTALPNNNGYQIAWEDTLDNGSMKSDRDFNDLVLKVETLDNFAPAIGTKSQDKSAGCIIDLGTFGGQTFKVDTRTISDAAYNNYIGFYAVTDDQGTLTNGLKPSDPGYAQAAVNSAILRSFKTESKTDLTVAGGQILAPIAIANGTFDDFLKPENIKNDANSQVHAYFNYIGANPDKVDHFRLLGDNTFGVEDMYGGGDRDYNDIILKLNIKS